MRARGRPGTHPAYPVAFRIRAARLYVDEGYSASLVAREMGCSVDSVHAWGKRYRAEGEAGLRDRTSSRASQGPPEAVKSAILSVKSEYPWYGIRRIRQFLRRMLHLPASESAVRRTLAENDLVEKPARRPRRNPSQPRRFERATPNQMWQTDIFTFRLAGSNAYAIGFLDDYSRYVVSLGLYRSQTANNVLETYRRGIGEYGVPREMLTDNGRQYTNWRGTTRFERELAKDRVKHIKSRPHHPMTLGKIERFWKSMWTEFLDRAQFDTFEQARERVALWVRYYNHRRPHQGIGGLCPADRFFEVAHELRGVIERDIEENVLELALRGEPRKPFYMVGRLDRQSVVMEARKGKLTMTVDDHASNERKELVYDVDQDELQCDEDGRRRQEATAAAPDLHGAGEVPGGAGGLDRDEDGQRDGARPADDLDAAERLAEAGPGRDAAGAGGPQAEAPEDPGAERQAEEAPGEQGSGRAGVRGGDAGPEEAPRAGGGEKGGDALTGDARARRLARRRRDMYDEGWEALFGPGADASPTPRPPAAGDQRAVASAIPETNHDQTRADREAPRAGQRGPTTRGDDRPGTGRPPYRHLRGPEAGGIPEDLLRMGGARPGGHAEGSGGPSDRTPVQGSGRQDGAPGAGAGRPEEGAGREGPDHRDQGPAPQHGGTRWDV
jgi:transposase InsO family protein